MSAYRTTLSKRTRRLTAADFTSVKGFDINGKENIDLWNHFVPYHPRRIYNLFSEGLSAAPKVDMFFSKEPYLVLKVNPLNKDDFEPTLYDVEGHYDIIHGRMDSVSHMIVHEKSRNQGTGRILVRGMMELAAALNFREFAFGGGLGNGAYTWSRMGAHLRFDVDTHYIDITRNMLSDQLLKRLDIVEEYMSRYDYRAAKILCHLQNKDDLVRLAQMKHVALPHDLKPDVDEVVCSPVNDGLKASYDDEEIISQELYRISGAFNFAAEQGAELNLPLYLLAGTSHDMFVDFSKARQMKQVGNYIGGWKTIAPSVRHPAMVAEPA